MIETSDAADLSMERGPTRYRPCCRRSTKLGRKKRQQRGASAVSIDDLCLFEEENAYYNRPKRDQMTNGSVFHQVKLKPRLKLELTNEGKLGSPELELTLEQLKDNAC